MAGVRGNKQHTLASNRMVWRKHMRAATKDAGDGSLDRALGIWQVLEAGPRVRRSVSLALARWKSHPRRERVTRTHERAGPG